MRQHVRFSNRHFLYAVRRNLCLPRSFVIAENYRRFWRRHSKGWV
jgi:hypothetical protein